MRERLIWLSIGIASIWLAVTLVSIFAPDFVSGSEQEHIPFAALFTWIPGAFASRSVLNEMVRRRHGKIEPKYVWAGIAITTAGIWLAVTLVSIFVPRMETGSDPTRIPIAALLAPIGGAIGTAMACGYARVLEEGLE
ncbi:MAG: hypothetical protein JSU97_07940 [Dehalococcoidia bacterium]|nr:MAG: hypothetical protein JSU97_07940 [Dehalococcoidia bacterium]